jgi:hypothetical protein
MIAAFVYLFVCSLRNRVRVRLRRLRQPRYLVASLAGALYLYTFVFRRVNRAGRAAPTPLALFERASHAIEVAGALALFAIAVAAWVLPMLGRAIEFSRAETQFLLQAPLTRRQLLHYKLLRGQIGVLLATAITTLVLRPTSFVSGWTFLTGTWLVLAVVRLHLTGVALRRGSVARHGRRGLEREWLPLFVAVAATLILIGSLAADWRALAALTAADDVFREVGRVVTSGAAQWVLWPVRALARLPLSASPSAFLRDLPVVLTLVVLNYVWVLRADVAFEEASSADASDRARSRARRGPRIRSGKAAPFRLAALGPPETAIVWKNLILLGRFASARVLFALLPLLVVAFAMSRRSTTGIGSSIGALSLVGAGMTTLLGPQMMRNDLRQDLANLAVLKSWPIRGGALVRGEILAPGVVLSCAAWLLIGMVVALHPPARAGAEMARELARHPVSLGMAAAALAPAIILTQLVVQNGLAILFPAWIATTNTQSRGIDAMGHRLLTLAGVMVTLVLALVPGAIAGGALGYLLHLIAPQARAPVIILPAILAAGVVLGECWLATTMLGGVFDRTDVSAMDAVE